MNRFRNYKLICYRRDKGMRMIVRGKDYNTANDYHKVNDPNRAHFLQPPVMEYRIQSHHSFLGIPYWKTLVKTTSYKIANDAYGLMVYDGKIGF